MFTFNQDWNSAIPVPITGGGHGANTLAGAQSALGVVADAFGDSQVANTPWIALTLQNGWTTTPPIGRAVYRKVNGMLQIDIINASGGATAGMVTMFALPAGYRPTFNKAYVLIAASTGGGVGSFPQRIGIDTQGIGAIEAVNPGSPIYLTVNIPLQ
ncbi:MAG: hypothetical protein ACEQSN_17090 [Yersinia sp. (in: enterobacteria)]